MIPRGAHHSSCAKAAQQQAALLLQQAAQAPSGPHSIDLLVAARASARRGTASIALTAQGSVLRMLLRTADATPQR